jgi:ADP-ribosyl-[dinitrogen reductase] hydrolase
MRCLPTGLVRGDAATRRAEAREISAVTHAEERCLDACMIYCDLVAFLLEGLTPVEALDRLRAETLPLCSEATLAELSLDTLAERPVEEVPTSGYVIDTLQAGIWALLQEGVPAEETLIALVNRGDDADSVGAVAGGLLGARDGVSAWPARWVETLEYGSEFSAATEAIIALRAEKN